MKKSDVQVLVERALAQPTPERMREVLEYLQKRLNGTIRIPS